MRKEKISAIFLFCFISIILGFWVTFLLPDMYFIFAASGTNDGTMISMDSGDIVDSSFSDGGTIKALDFDGANDMVDVGNDTSLQITNNLSVIAWVNAGAQGVSDYIAQKYYTDQMSWMMKTDSTDSTKLYIQISDDGSTAAGSTKLYVSSANVLSAGWHQVGFTFADDTLKVYVDGSDITASCTKTNDSTVNTLHNSTRNLEIAGFNGDSNANWTGEMVNVSVWDTGVLSTTTISNLYNSGNGIDPNNVTPDNNANLVSSWLWNTSLTYPTIPDNANIPPTLTAITPIQTSGPIVTVTTTVADADSDVTSLTLEYSLDNVTWATATTTGNVTASEGTVTTSTGSIASIDTNVTGSVDLTIEWMVGTDIPLTDDTEIYFRLTPNDGTTDGTTITSGAFAVDTKPPTNPGNLTVNSTSTTSVILNYGSATVDTNFTEYKIFYKIGGAGVTNFDTAFTSSSDANLGDISFNGASTTTILGLAVNTQYVTNIWAYESWSNNAPALNEIAFFTLANTPGTPTVTVSSTTALNLVIDQNLNPSNTIYSICETSDGSSCVGGGFVQADGTLGASAVWDIYTNLGGASGKDIIELSPNSDYRYLVQARNGNGVDTAYSSANATVYTLADIPNTPASVTSTAATTLNITLGADNGGTTYLVHDSVDDKYLIVDGTWSSSSSSAWLSYSALGGGSATTTTGLLPNTNHTIEIKAKNADGVETAYSSSLSSYTLANAAGTPTIGIPAATTLPVTINVNSNPASTEFAIQEVGSGNYVQTDGSLSGSAIWKTALNWGTGSTKTVIGLSSNTSYQFKVKARNGDSIETAFSTASTATYTLANAAGAPTIGTPTISTLPITIDVNSNSASVTYAVYNSTDSNYLDTSGASTSTAVYSTTSTLGSSFAATGLSLNTAYQFTVIARNADSVDATTSTASTATYTLANAAGVPTVGTPTATTLPIAIDVNSNPAVTTYAVYNFTDNNYLDSAGASTSTAVYSTTSTLGSSFAATGLSANTSYQFTVVAKNGDAVVTATSSASTATYTGANIPSSVSATADSTTQITLTWSGDATEYYAENTTASTNSGWDSATTFVSTGLTCGTSYSFRVKGKNADDVETAYASSVSATTSDCPVASGGGIAPASTPPSLPSISVPVSSPTIKNIEVGVGEKTSVSVDSASHTVTVHSASAGVATITIESDPITVTLTKNQYQDIDTNTDTIDDLRVTYLGLIGGEPKFSILNLTDGNELQKPVAINYGAYDSNSQTVILSLNVPDATQMAVSNYPDFRNTSFEDYKDIVNWELLPEIGESSVYVRFRSEKGGTADASDTIYLASTSGKAPVITTPVDLGSDTCILTEKQSYKHPASPSVYYITSDCTKRAFKRSDIFFTYFDSWDDVKTTTKTKLDSITDDTLGFMPWGPNYDPKYGALVKIVTDPKVYLLLGTEKYWITSETVFNSLNYAWNWIEDISGDLLDKYTLGSEITYTDHHPDHTLIKYENSPKVYKLEEGKKRYITDEATFNSLNFRWDRIVTVDEDEVYEDGEELVI